MSKLCIKSGCCKRRQIRQIIYLYSLKMAHSFIAYSDKNIRVNDFDLIALVFLLKVTAFKGGANSRLLDMFSIWIDSIENDGAGNIDLQLDLLLKSPEDLASLLVVLKDFNESLAELPETISADFLRQLVHIKGVEFGDYKKIFLKNIAGDFDRLLRTAGKN